MQGRIKLGSANAGAGAGMVLRFICRFDLKANDQADAAPAVELILLDPIPSSGLSLGPSLGPSLLQGVGHTPEDSQNGCCAVMANPALILTMGYIQGVVGPILDAPALLLQ
jgi:hypothetical protein